MPEFEKSQANISRQLRRISIDREAELREISTKTNPTMDDFWRLQNWRRRDGALKKRGDWEDPETRRAAIRFLVTRVLQFDDITKIKATDFKRNRLYGLLGKSFGNSPYAAVSFAFPELGLQPWEMETVPTRYWKDEKHIADAVLRLEKKLGKSAGELTSEDFIENELMAIFKHCGLSEAVRLAHPELSIKPWLVGEHIPAHYWDNPTNVREAIVWLEERTGKKPEELCMKDFLQNSLGGVLHHYHNRMHTAIRIAHPELTIDPMLYTVPHGYWNSQENRIGAIRELARRTGKAGADLTITDFNSAGLRGLLSWYGCSPRRALAEAGFLRQESQAEVIQPAI